MNGKALQPISALGTNVKRSRIAVFVVVVIVFFAVNILVFWTRFNSSRANGRRDELGQAEANQQAKRKDAILSSWNRGAAEPIGTVTFRSRLDREGSADCFQQNSKREEVNASMLTEQQRSDLNDALCGMLKALQSSNPATVIAFMLDRGKSPSPAQAEAYRRFLVKSADPNWFAERGLIPESLGDAETLTEFWNYPKTKESHWSGVVMDETCWHLWQAGKADEPEIRKNDDLVNSLFDVFKNVRSWAHSFNSTDGLEVEDAIQKNGHVFVADVRLLVEHDEELLGQRAPYLVRFWWNPRCARWQPIVLARVNTFQEEKTANPMF